MDTIFMSTANSKTPQNHRLSLRLVSKMEPSYVKKSVDLSNLFRYYNWKIICSVLKNNKFEIGGNGWKKDFDLPDGSYSVKDISDYFKEVFKKYDKTYDKDNPGVYIYADKVRNRIDFMIHNRYYLKLLTRETMELLGSSKELIDKDKTGELIPKIENVNLVLVQCNLEDNAYQTQSKVLYNFVPVKPYGSLLNIEPKNNLFLRAYGEQFYNIHIWFTDQDDNPLAVEDSISLTLMIKEE